MVLDRQIGNGGAVQNAVVAHHNTCGLITFNQLKTHVNGLHIHCITAKR